MTSITCQNCGKTGEPQSCPQTKGLLLCGSCEKPLASSFSSPPKAAPPPIAPSPAVQNPAELPTSPGAPNGCRALTLPDGGVELRIREPGPFPVYGAMAVGYGWWKFLPLATGNGPSLLAGAFFLIATYLVAAYLFGAKILRAQEGCFRVAFGPLFVPLLEAPQEFPLGPKPRFEVQAEQELTHFTSNGQAPVYVFTEKHARYQEAFFVVAHYADRTHEALYRTLSKPQAQWIAAELNATFEQG